MYKLSFLEILIMNNSPYYLGLGKRITRNTKEEEIYMGKEHIYEQGM